MRIMQNRCGFFFFCLFFFFFFFFLCFVLKGVGGEVGEGEKYIATLAAHSAIIALTLVPFYLMQHVEMFKRTPQPARTRGAAV